MQPGADICSFSWSPLDAIVSVRIDHFEDDKFGLGLLSFLPEFDNPNRKVVGIMSVNIMIYWVRTCGGPGSIGHR